MLLKSLIFDSQSFVLHKNGIEFHQEFNGSIHIWLVTSYGVVRYINTELKYANVVWTQFLILPAPDILLMYTNMLTLTQGPEVHYFEELFRQTFVYFSFSNLNNCTKTMKIIKNMRTFEKGTFVKNESQ